MQLCSQAEPLGKEPQLLRVGLVGFQQCQCRVLCWPAHRLLHSTPACLGTSVPILELLPAHSSLFYFAHTFNVFVMKLCRYKQEYKQQAECSSVRIISDNSQMSHFIFLSWLSLFCLLWFSCLWVVLICWLFFRFWVGFIIDSFIPS